MPSQVCVLLSGGLDSALLLAEAKRLKIRTHLIFVTFGFPWEAAELHFLKQISSFHFAEDNPPIEIRSFPYKNFYPLHWGFYPELVPDSQSPDRAVGIPHRNKILLENAFTIAQSRCLDEIWLGTLRGNPFHDTSPKFFHDLEQSFNITNPFTIRVQAPFAQRSKSELIRTFPNFPFALTLSCLKPRDLFHCGQCNKCGERQRAFAQSGIPDPTHYRPSLKTRYSRHVY